MNTEGGGHIIVTQFYGSITKPDSQRLIRLTVTGMDGRTVYVFLTRQQASNLAFECEGINAE